MSGALKVGLKANVLTAVLLYPTGKIQSFIKPNVIKKPTIFNGYFTHT